MMDPGHVVSAQYLCPDFVVVTGSHNSQNIGMGNTGQGLEGNPCREGMSRLFTGELQHQD